MPEGSSVASGAATGAAAGTAVYPGIGTIAGAVIGGAASYFGGQAANNSAKAQSVQQMVFQREMANTAHQREVADLRAAGLNPILSGTGGRGAESPSGSAAPQSDYVTPAVNSAMNAFKLGIEAGNTMALTAKNQTETAWIGPKATSDISLQGGQESSARSQAQVNQQQADVLELQKQVTSELVSNTRTLGLGYKIDNLIKSQDLQSAIREAKKARNEGAIDDTKFGKFMSYVDRALRGLNPVIPGSHVRIR